MKVHGIKEYNINLSVQKFEMSHDLRLMLINDTLDFDVIILRLHLLIHKLDYILDNLKCFRIYHGDEHRRYEI